MLNINKLPDSPIKYRLILDIDAVFCQKLHDLQYYDQTINQDLVSPEFPEGVILYSKYLLYQYTYQDLYFCYQNFDKLVLSVLSWDGWSVDFFSAGIAERNEVLISGYFIKKFVGYSHNPQGDYLSIVAAGRIQIFSYNHMVVGEKDFDRSSYERYGQLKKDLTVISSDISNIVIADDDRSYILGSQYPYIGLSGSASQDFSSVLAKKSYKSLEDLPFNPNKNANYIMGIILSCKEMLDNNETNSLREALDLQLRHNGDSIIKPHNDYGSRNYDYSPWFLNPGSELLNSSKDSAYYIKMTGWINKGQDYFDSFYDLDLFE